MVPVASQLFFIQKYNNFFFFYSESPRPPLTQLLSLLPATIFSLTTGVTEANQVLGMNEMKCCRCQTIRSGGNTLAKKDMLLFKKAVANQIQLLTVMSPMSANFSICQRSHVSGFLSTTF